MASAKAATVVKEVVLTLSGEEASTLREVCRHIAGDPKYSRRRHTSDIGNALDSAGILSLGYHGIGQISFEGYGA